MFCSWHLESRAVFLLVGQLVETRKGTIALHLAYLPILESPTLRVQYCKPFGAFALTATPSQPSVSTDGFPVAAQGLREKLPYNCVSFSVPPPNIDTHLGLQYGESADCHCNDEQACPYDQDHSCCNRSRQSNDDYKTASVLFPFLPPE